ncbi:acetyl-CoA synthetase-like protein [Mycena crocata]|nr:acetyl-CoA synthetase-like protein [Mycena crocata]
MTMTEFYGGPSHPHVPDDLTLGQFMLEYQHPLRPAQGTIPCLIEEATGRGISLPELGSRTSGLAKSLREKYNISENQVVLVCSPNHVDYPVAIWACHYLGAIFTGANPGSTPAELVYQLKITGATLIIAHSTTFETAVKAAELAGLSADRVIAIDTTILISDGIAAGVSKFAAVKLGPGEGKTRIAALCMSSGTTGPPKAVAISHTAIISNLIQLSFLDRDLHKIFVPGDIVLGVLPFFHIAGFVVSLHWMLFCGTTLVVIQKFDFIQMLDSIVRHRMHHVMLVPPMAVALCKHPIVKNYDLSGIKFLGSGAAPLSSELQDQMQQLCPQAVVGQAYGLTETPILAMSPVSRSGSSGSAGMLLPGIQARVVKSDGSLAGYNEPGELVVKTPSASLGYYKNQEATDEAFTADGWFRTGDEVKIAENGEIWITDRLKELIKVRGFQVSPAELEGHILNHPDVADACVVGAPDVASGEVPLAFVVLTEDAQKRARANPGLIQASIQQHVADNKIKYKHLVGGVEFVPLIPKNPSGKILRRVLREQVKQRAKL